jgi:hypothetical protein
MKKPGYFFVVVDVSLHRGSGGCLFTWLWILCIESVSEVREREKYPWVVLNFITMHILELPGLVKLIQGS